MVNYTNWQHNRASVSRSLQNITALSSLRFLNQVVFDSDGEYTVNDLQLHIMLHRTAATIGKIIFAVVPDDIYTAMTSLDLHDPAVLSQYEEYFWLEHTFFFGQDAGEPAIHIQLKTGTMRQVHKHDKVVILIQLQDTQNVATGCNVGWTFDYFVRSRTGTV